MKISNVDVDFFLKNAELKIKKEESNKLTSRKPSMKKKHIKKPKKVEEALDNLMNKHNHSWYDEVKERYSDSMDKVMTFYRGNEKTGKEVFEEADMLANALSLKGIKKGDEIIACMSNTPEVLTLLLAASKCGAIVNFIGEGFDREFIKNIINNNSKKMFIGTDDLYGKIEDIINKADFQNTILVSLTDSLKNGKDPYEKYDNDFYKFINKVPEFQKKDHNIINFKAFKELGKHHHARFPQVGINDILTVTYTSGSTKIGWPEAIMHRNKAYTSIGRFHDSDLSRMPAMRDMRGLAHIPTHSNTNIVSCISDPLMQKCTVAFEPIYNPKFFARSLVINEVGFVAATRSFWVEAINQFKTDPKVIGKKLPFAINYVSVGEDICKNEIRYIDNGFKELEAGSKKLIKPLYPITLSVGGGNCEHGGLFFTLFKSLREKISLSKNLRKEYGLTPFQLADIAVLRDDGTECNYEEIGNLVANSVCTMAGYKNNLEANKSFYKMDTYGRAWGNCNVWAYIAKNGNVVIKGRKDSKIELSTKKEVPNFLITDTILESNKNLLSCEVVTVKDNEQGDIAVAHIMFDKEYEEQYTNPKKTLIDIDNICKEKFSQELYARVVYRIHYFDDSFELTKSGKRNISFLEKEALDYAVKPVDVLNDGKPMISPARLYKDSFMSYQKQFAKIKK